ncbi:MAG: hypothetical protein Cons2KO_34210 [Congregibacter sp.]
MAIIQSYGLFWTPDDVYWGRGRQAGELLGIPVKAKTADPINFRDQVGIYVLYSGHEIVYVGQAGAKNAKLFGRLKKHRSDALQNRWDKFSWFGLRRPFKEFELSTASQGTQATLGTALNHIEAVLIASAEPPLNRQGGRFGRGSKRYLQVRDPRLGPTESDMVRELWEARQQQ